LDSGASRNFIDEKFVKQSRLITKVISPILVELADGRKTETNRIVDIHKLELDSYHTTGISAQVTKLQRYDVILGKPWLYHANPSIDWRANTLTFQYGPKTIVVNADSKNTHKEPSCNTIFIFQRQTNELTKEERNLRGVPIGKELIARTEGFTKHTEQAWSNIREKVIYPDHSNHNQNENHLVKEGIDVPYHYKMEDLKLETSKAMKDYQDTLRHLKKKLLQRSDDSLHNNSKLEDWADKRLATLEEHKVDPLVNECLYNEDQVKELLEEHEGFLAKNTKTNLEDINQIKEGIEKLTEDIKSSKCDDIVGQNHSHDDFKKLIKKFAELQSKSSARKSDLSMLQPHANWEDQFAPGMQSLNDLIDRKARWRSDDATSSSSDNNDKDKIISNEKDKINELGNFTGKKIDNNGKTNDDFSNGITTSLVVFDIIPISDATSTNNDKTTKPKLGSTRKSDGSADNISKDYKTISTKRNTNSDEKVANRKVKEFKSMRTSNLKEGRM